MHNIALIGSTEDADSTSRADVVILEEFIQSDGTHSRWAVIKNHPASYGTMRMLSVFLEEVPMVLKIFGTLGGGREVAVSAERQQGANLAGLTAAFRCCHWRTVPLRPAWELCRATQER